MTTAIQTEQLFGQALRLHQAGDVARAEALYRQILTVDPANPGVIFLFGLCHHQRGDHAAAIELMDVALDMNPAMPQAHYNRGLALQKLERHAEAIASYDRAIALQPGYALAWNNRGNALQSLGRHDEALASLDRAVSLAPTFAEAHTNRGNVLKSLRRSDEALASHDRAIALRPDYAEAHCNRGNALKAVARLDEALASYDRAIALKDDFIDAWINRGDTLHQLERMDDALASYDQAIARDPRSAQAFQMRGNLLLCAKRTVEGCADLQHACALDPAMESEVVWQLAHAKMLLCDWQGLDPLLRSIAAQKVGGWAGMAPFAALSILAAPAQQLACNRTYVRTWIEDLLPRDALPLWQGERYGHRRIRVGYVSPDLRNHAVAYLTAGLFERHDREHFEVHAFYLGPETDDGWHRRLRQAIEHFHDVKPLDDDALAALIRRLEIDILVDLGGHTQGARLDVFARRPAPVQVNYLGYPGTLGAPFIDYILADRIVIPPEHFGHYCEKVAWLPHCFQANDDAKAIADPAPARAELGLPQDGFVFCCFNNSYKITPELFAIWMRLLENIPGSVLWCAAADPAASANLRREAQRHGVAAERLVFAARRPLADYLASYWRADLFLDSFCYNAGTTASDALWAGLPVLTRPGATFASRMAASLLHAAGLPELVARDDADYERIALELATRPQRLAELRSRLQRNRLSCPLFDTARFARDLEAVYTAMWRRSEAGLPPEHIRLQA
jgi:predicted O-linked N-acetylglucosamine transferase (SPINDLY family)